MAIRVVMFVFPAIWVGLRPGFQLHEMWYVSIVTMFLQMIISYVFVRREFAKRLTPLAAPAPA